MSRVAGEPVQSFAEAGTSAGCPTFARVGERVSGSAPSRVYFKCQYSRLDRRIARHDLRDLRWVSIKDAHSGDFASVANRASHDQNSGGAERQVGALFEKTNGLASRACQELLHRVVRNLGQD